MSKPFCHWPLAPGFCLEPNLISPYMPIFMPGTGEGATPNRSLLDGGGALRLRSAAGRNFAPESESANAEASRDTGVTDDCSPVLVSLGADGALSAVFDPLGLMSLGSASATAS